MASMTLSSGFDAVRLLLPAGTAGYVAELLGRWPCDLRLSRPRRSKLGDHRPPRGGRGPHRITVNDDLNPYALLTTLLHEFAHAAAWERWRHGRRRVRPHGPEWQEEFSRILGPVVAAGVLPDDVTVALGRAVRRPAAATCSARELAIALARYDAPGAWVFVADLPEGAVFRIDGGAVFRAGRWLRSRRQCFECRTGREYRVHGLARVTILEMSAGRRRRLVRGIPQERLALADDASGHGLDLPRVDRDLDLVARS
jgi:hypothetical protein